jgi:hypothetical protein
VQEGENAWSRCKTAGKCKSVKKNVKKTFPQIFASTSSAPNARAQNVRR